MAVTVVKEMEFQCAHQLIGHDRGCKNIHGHSYKLQVGIRGGLIKEGSSKGMVIDFGHVKKLMEELVKDTYDHAFIAEGTEPILAPMMELGYKVHVIDKRTTAENMVLDIGRAFIAMESKHQLNAEVSFIRLWETTTSYAEATRNDIMHTLSQKDWLAIISTPKEAL